MSTAQKGAVKSYSARNLGWLYLVPENNADYVMLKTLVLGALICSICL